MKKTIPSGTKKVDVRAPRERGGKDKHPNTCTAEPRARERHRGEHSGRAEDRKPWWRIWWDQHQREAPGIEGQLKVSLGSGENDEVISIELASVTEGVRGGEGNTRDGRAKGDSETVNQ